MSRLSDDNKVVARTAPSIAEGVRLVVIRLQSAGYKFRGRKIGIEAVVSSVLLDFLKMKPEQQSHIVDVRLPEVEALIEASEGGAGQGAASEPVSRPERPGNIRETAPEAVRQKSRKTTKKRG